VQGALGRHGEERLHLDRRRELVGVVDHYARLIEPRLDQARTVMNEPYKLAAVVMSTQTA
jgi:hypothetical protein